MQDSKRIFEQYRTQADEMIAVAAKTPLPTIYAEPFKAVAVAHGCWNIARRNTLLDILK
jgi:hypothetical protein